MNSRSFIEALVPNSAENHPLSISMCAQFVTCSHSKADL
jgi:hypothetical protein